MIYIKTEKAVNSVKRFSMKIGQNDLTKKIYKSNAAPGFVIFQPKFCRAIFYENRTEC